MKWIRKALKGISLTAALFVFQACYGTMNDYYEAMVTFHVVDDKTGEPLQGVDIWAVELASDSTSTDAYPYKAAITDENGIASFWTASAVEQYSIVDKDSAYVKVDTILQTYDTDTINIRLTPVNRKS